MTLGGPWRGSKAELSVTIANIFNDSPAGADRLLWMGPGTDVAATRRYALQYQPRLVTLGMNWSF